MTINEAISKADEVRNNKIDYLTKLRMLSELDGRIFYEVISPNNEADFDGYTESTPSDTSLLVPYPYDELYIAYLEAEICRYSGEIQKYSTARGIFYDKYNAYTSWYVRTHPSNTPRITFPQRRY
jgi:hypothetical protein